MNCQLTNRFEPDSKDRYATREDFRRLFTEHVNGLYLLSFLLTADHEKAEQCFVDALNDCVNESKVFQDWASSWARRVIVRNSIRSVAPHISSARSTPGAMHSQVEYDLSAISAQDTQFASVLALGDVERFVYVLSVLERYSIQDCAALLGISPKAIREERVHAFQHLELVERRNAVPTNGRSNTERNTTSQ